MIRFRGIYVPPVAPKHLFKDKSEQFKNESVFLMNHFVKRVAMCPYLLESKEMELFMTEGCPDFSTAVKGLQNQQMTTV